MKQRLLKTLLRENPKHRALLFDLAETVGAYIVKSTPRGATFLDFGGRTQTSGIKFCDIDANGHVEFHWGYDPIASANSVVIRRKALKAFEKKLLASVADLKFFIAQIELAKELAVAEIRTGFADYVTLEGCESEKHDAAEKRLGALLKAKKYADKAGFDWCKYTTEPGKLLNESEVFSIKQLGEQKYPHADIALRYGVSAERVKNIINEDNED